MVCSQCKEKMMLMIDDELNKFSTEMLLEHLKTCSQCKKDYDKMIDAVNLLKPGPFLKSLRSEIMGQDFDGLESKKIKKNSLNLKNRIGGFAMKRKITAAFVSALVIAVTFIPLGGKSLAMNIEEWVSNISFMNSGKSNGLDTNMRINVSADITAEEAQRLVEEQKNIKVDIAQTKYDSLEDAREKSSVDFKIPERIPEDLKLVDIKGMPSEGGSIYSIVLNYINDGSTIQYEENSDIKIQELRILFQKYMTQLDPNFEYNLRLWENSKIKEVEILNKKGFIRKYDEPSSPMTIVTFVLPEIEFSLSATIDGAGYSDEVQHQLEQQLASMAESILKQYQ